MGGVVEFRREGRGQWRGSTTTYKIATWFDARFFFFLSEGVCMKRRDAAAAPRDAALQFERSTFLAHNQPPQFSSCVLFFFLFLRIDLEMKHEGNAG